MSFVIKLQRLVFFDGEEAMLDDFDVERFEVYKKKYIDCECPAEINKTVVISTTFHTDTRKYGSHYIQHLMLLVLLAIHSLYNIEK